MSLVVSSPKHSSLKERNMILKCASENTPEWAIPILRKEKPVLFFAVLGTPAMCATRRIVLVVLIFYVTRHRNAETCIFFFFKIIEICCCFTFFLVLSLNSHFQNVLFLTLSLFHITVKKQKTKNQDVLKWFLVQQPTPTFLACCCRCCLLIVFF